MSSVSELRNRLLERPAVRGALERLGINARQFRLLLDLFDTLAERYEMLGTINTLAMTMLVASSVFMGIILSLYALARPPLPNYLFASLGFTMFQLLIIISGDAANSLLNPQEASVLAHQPIGSLTYAAAKISHLVLIVVVLATAVNIMPALVGTQLAGTRWFLPITHLLAAYLAGLFVAFLVCGIYGWMFQFFAPERLKGIALGIQVGILALMPMAGAVLGPILRTVKHLQLEQMRWAWFPPNWFVSTALLGHPGLGYSGWQAALAILASAAFIAFGLRCFRYEYLARATMIVQGRSHFAAERSRRGLLTRAARMVTGSPAGTGAFAFTGAMMRRDWNFRRQALPMAALLAYCVIMLILMELRVSPFAPGKFALIHVLPHALGLMLILPACLISQADQPQGAWVFLILPFRNPTAFARGIYSSLWLPGVGVPHLLLILPAIWFWGWWEALIFLAYSLALASLYLSAEFFMLEGLPFANPVRSSAQAMLVPVMVLGGMGAAILGFLQWLIFHSHMAAAIAAGVVILLAAVVTPWSLTHLASEFRANLLTLAQGPTRLFKTLD